MSTDLIDLLHQASKNDESALGHVLEECCCVLTQRLSGRIPPPHQSSVSADDVIQETCIEIAEAIRCNRFHVRDEPSFWAWVWKIADHNVKDVIRELNALKRGGKHRRIDADQWLFDALCGEGSTPSHRARRREAISRMWEAVGRLPDALRTLIQLHYSEQRPMTEVASVLGCSPGAAFMRHSRALRLLKDIMGGSASTFLSDSV